MTLFQSLFVVCFFGFFHPLRRHHYRWRYANFDLYSALIAIEQRGFLADLVPIWRKTISNQLAFHTYNEHGTTVYNNHWWGPITLTPVADRITVSLSLPISTKLRSVAAGIRRTNPQYARRTLCARATDRTKNLGLKKPN